MSVKLVVSFLIEDAANTIAGDISSEINSIKGVKKLIHHRLKHTKKIPLPGFSGKD